MKGHRQDYSYLLITDIQANGRSLVSDEERARFEGQATRAAHRYNQRMAELVAELAYDEAVGDTEDAARVEDAIEDVPSETSETDAAKGKPKK